jgi:KaiC/GvpD/RAD55 family RecA-like ATPase
MLVRKMRGTAVPPIERAFEIEDGQGIVLARSSFSKAVPTSRMPSATIPARARP